MASRADLSLHQKLKHYTSPDILLIDELGFDRLEQQDTQNASLFFKVIDGRYCKGSTLLTTNIDFKDLGDYLGDPVVTTAAEAARQASGRPSPRRRRRRRSVWQRQAQAPPKPLDRASRVHRFLCARPWFPSDPEIVGIILKVILWSQPLYGAIYRIEDFESPLSSDHPCCVDTSSFWGRTKLTV